MLRPALIALQFLTRVPVRLARPPSDRELGDSLVWYPPVGLLLGLGLWGASLGLVGLPGPLAAALLLALWTAASGALHLDGLADCVDAWSGGLGDRERTLAIMKDPCSGPMGVTALVLTLLVKFAALHALLEAQRTDLLAWAPLLGRTAVPLLFLTTPYVRSGGLGAALSAQLPRKAATIVVGAALLLSGAGLGVMALAAWLPALLTLVWWRHQLRRRLGGLTGDAVGAAVELTELAVLIALAGLLGGWDAPG